ncbi:ABC transporter permease [Micromonospora inaquosa]|uniref:ABC transporter n=1 Tax=Micromonospora inaquosa TaxID=2203716 RepID=A0A3N9W5T7_9ACTN|nr:ABC transporter permease [Micromonospora inaquosa]RQW96180.1 ABC transporter [Micromonospora inaquosa]
MRPLGLSPSRLSPRDLCAEAVTGILQRPARTALTAIGVVLGVGAFVAVLGLTSTASGQISERFTALVATEVTVEESPGSDGAREASVFPADADSRLRALNGVVDAGVFWPVPDDTITSVVALSLPGSRGEDYVPVMAASPGVFGAVRATISLGRTYDDFHNSQATQVAVLGVAAASRLGVTRVEASPVIFVNGIPLTVIGIVNDVARRPELLSAVLVPRGTVEKLLGSAYDSSQPPQMVIETRLGAGQLVAEQAAVALRPDLPNSFKVTAPPNPRMLREQVTADLSILFLLLATICLIIGAASIANTMVVAVLERVPEIGLRRALGARRRHVAAQFLAESTALGTVGGLTGVGIGVGCVVAVAATQDWTPIMEPVVVLPAPLLGSVIGLLAGVYPAVRAAHIEPADAL